VNKGLICVIPPASALFTTKTDGGTIFFATTAVWASVE